MNKAQVSFDLRKYRALHGLTQAQLAEKLGTRIEQICRWERSRHLPQRKWIALMKERGIIQ